MSGLRITNEITNLDGPGPPVVQTDFAPQGHTELLATGSATALARVRPGQRASVRYALNPPGAPPAAAPGAPPAAAPAAPPARASAAEASDARLRRVVHQGNGALSEDAALAAAIEASLADEAPAAPAAGGRVRAVTPGRAGRVKGVDSIELAASKTLANSPSTPSSRRWPSTWMARKSDA